MFNYFTSKSIEYAFYLIELTGEERLKKLHITKMCHRYKDLADNKYNEIKEEINKLDNKEMRDTAIDQLDRLYNSMITYAK